MKRPFCNVDGKRYQLYYYNGVLRFPNNSSSSESINQMIIDYANKKIKLEKLWNYYINSGCSYQLVWDIFSRKGCNNHIVLQGAEKTKSMRLYI